MVVGVQRRLVVSYAAVVAATLLLLGPVLYVSFSHQMADASDAALRLAAQRQAALALVGNGTTLGINPRFKAPLPLAERDTFYLLLSPTGRLQGNPTQVQQRGLPDLAAARQAAAARIGVFSTLTTPHAGVVRLVTIPLLRAGRVVGLLQAGKSLATLAAAQQSLLVFLLELGAAALGAATIGGLLLTRQAMRPVQAAFAAQRAFVADASHELRTPVTLIRTNAEVLLEAEAIPDHEDRALVEDIVATTEQMGRLIRDLLTLARLDAGALPLEQAPVDLAVLAAESCRAMQRLAERSGVQLQARHGSPVVVQSDAARLRQVLTILLDNAIRYNGPGGQVTVSVRREGGHAVLDVRDTGSGIPADEIPHLFSRFHRGPGSRERSEGSGLGLAIAAGIVHAHQGRLEVQSTPGVGSLFTLRVPLTPRWSVRSGSPRHAVGQGAGDTTLPS